MAIFFKTPIPFAHGLKVVQLDGNQNLTYSILLMLLHQAKITHQLSLCYYFHVLFHLFFHLHSLGATFVNSPQSIQALMKESTE